MKIIQDIFRKKLKQNPHELDLSDNKLSFSDIAFIAKNLPLTHVVSLNLSNNFIGDKGIKYLAEVLPYTNIKSLDLSNNFIGDEGIKHLAQFLPNSQLTSLNLNHNYIGQKGLEHLSLSLPNTKIIFLNLYFAKGINPTNFNQKLANSLNKVIEKDSKKLFYDEKSSQEEDLVCALRIKSIIDMATLEYYFSKPYIQSGFIYDIETMIATLSTGSFHSKQEISESSSENYFLSLSSEFEEEYELMGEESSESEL